MSDHILLTSDQLAFAFRVLSFLAEHADAVEEYQERLECPGDYQDPFSDVTSDAGWSLERTCDRVWEVVPNGTDRESHRESHSEVLADVDVDQVVQEAQVLAAFFDANGTRATHYCLFDASAFADSDAVGSCIWLPRAFLEAIAAGMITEDELRR